ncbi:aldo/keto reductase [Vibrio quintilis]|uniref:General stress protein 69 n=1 Tax=Vibrio quintilis TaxID=1117707 RepID=A0A1M7YZZ3_9VIBR|nr:aldo/keto reductase [Vibrio quintilis]SHO58228.1 General stress protein 69 [Vibrio quintilis]
MKPSNDNCFHTQSGHDVPRVGLGCMGMSEFYGPGDDQQNLQLLEKAVALGYRYFDTADMYGQGHNETLLGEFLQRQNRQQLFIATKFGIKDDHSGKSARQVDGSPAYVREALEKSLARLKLDYVDLYYVHRRDNSTPIEETMAALAALKREGLIKSIGLSEVSVETYQRAQQVHPVAAVQSEYSLLSREPEQGILQACQANGTAFVAYSPMSRGLLSGAIHADVLNQPDDIRGGFPRFSGENLQHNLALVQQLTALAAQKQCTLAQVALAWVLHQSSHVYIIPGTRREKYLLENWQSSQVELTGEELTVLRGIFAPDQVAGARYPQSRLAGLNG